MHSGQPICLTLKAGDRMASISSFKSVLVALAAVAAGMTGCAGGRARTAVMPDVEPVMRRVADAVLRDFPKPPPFDWGEGVLMAGMMRAGLALNEPRYVAFVQAWADHWRQAGLEPVLEGAPNAKIRGYCGHWGPGFPVLMLYEKTKDPAYLTMAQQVVDFIQTRATRTSDGGLGHWAGNKQLWVDTLYMACPPLANLGRIALREDLTQEAVRQLGVFARHCQDAKTGLFYHMYDEPTQRCVGVLWGRGNGWVAMSYVEVLRHLDRRSPEYAGLLADFRRLVRGLLATQDQASGLWHTVLDRPESYLETSATAMILCALLEAQRAGMIRLDGPGAVERAWAGLATKVNEQGRVMDVSGGTMPGSYDMYAARPRGTETWGTGAFLLAASALHTK